MQDDKLSGEPTPRSWDESDEMAHIEDSIRNGEMNGTKPKMVRLHKEIIVSLSCPNCEEQIDNPCAGANIGFITEQEWSTIPNTVVCQSCGATLVVRGNPFRKRANREIIDAPHSEYCLCDKCDHEYYVMTGEQ